MVTFVLECRHPRLQGLKLLPRIVAMTHRLQPMPLAPRGASISQGRESRETSVALSLLLRVRESAAFYPSGRFGSQECARRCWSLRS